MEFASSTVTHSAYWHNDALHMQNLKTALTAFGIEQNSSLTTHNLKCLFKAVFGYEPVNRELEAVFGPTTSEGVPASAFIDFALASGGRYRRKIAQRIQSF